MSLGGWINYLNPPIVGEFEFPVADGIFQAESAPPDNSGVTSIAFVLNLETRSCELECRSERWW